jgi:hypothetical protein
MCAPYNANEATASTRNKQVAPSTVLPARLAKRVIFLLVILFPFLCVLCSIDYIVSVRYYLSLVKRFGYFI